MPRLKHNHTGEPAEDACGRRECGHVRRRHGDTCTGLHLDPFGGDPKPCLCAGFVEKRKEPKVVSAEVTMRLRWHGEIPPAGDYLMSSGVRTKYAYKIDAVKNRGANTRGELELDFTAVRTLVKDLPKDATIHPLRWDARNRRQDTGVGWGA